jgi:hypothetical protein
MMSAVTPTGDPDPASLIEAYFERGWTDGLPVVPPTEKSIAEMLAGAALRGDETLGEIAGRNTVVVAEKVAINAVMAGCRPEYMPVVVAAIRGLCHPDFAYHGPASSTGGSAMVLIASGPLAHRIGLNSGNNAFGQGWRPNATIGRAVRLTMMNAMQTRPGLLDRAVLGSPGKYSFCFAEREHDLLWEPFHVARGLRPEQSAVTVYASNSLYQVYNQLAAEPEPLLRRALQSRPSQREGLQPGAHRPGGRAHRGPSRERMGTARRPALPDRAYAPSRRRSEARGPPPGRRAARRRDHLALSVSEPGRHPDRLRWRSGGELVRVSSGLGQQVDEGGHHADRRDSMSAPLFDPTAGPVGRDVKIAPRPIRLDGLRIGLVENTKFNSDVLLRRLADRLGRRHGMTVARMVRKRSPSHEVDEAAVEALRAQSDFVVSGIGD